MRFKLPIILVLIVSTMQCVIVAQALNHSRFNNIDEADAYVATGNYYKAIKIYENAYDNNKILARKLGECYFILKDYAKAKEWFLKANIRSTGGSVNAIQQYAILLLLDGKNEKAKSFFGRMLKTAKEQAHLLNPSDINLDIQNINDYFNDNVKVELTKLNDTDSGVPANPNLYKDIALVYFTTKNNLQNQKIIHKKITNHKINKIQLTNTNQKNNLNNLILPEFDNQNFVCFFNNGNSAMITKKIKVPNNIKKDKSKRSIANTNYVLQLFTAKFNKKNKQWAKPKPIEELNSYYYSIAQPTINNKGDYMVFASNKYGGFGTTDLYETKYKNGKWTQPKNLGKNINTLGNELYPFIHKSNLLFASNYNDKLINNLDIFRAYKTNNTYVKEPFTILNTKNDDFALVINKSLNNSYFISNRDGKNTLYNANLSLVNKKKITLEFIDKNTKSLIDNVEVNILDKNFHVVKNLAIKNKTKIKLDVGKKYYIIAYKEGYFKLNTKINTNTQNDDNYRFMLKNSVTYNGFTGNKKHEKPVQNATMSIKNLNNNKEQNVTTNENGEYKFNVNPLTAYQITFKKNNTTINDLFFTGIDSTSFDYNVLNTASINDNEILDIKNKQKNIIANIKNDTIPKNTVKHKKIQKPIYLNDKRIYTPNTSTPKEINEKYGFKPNEGLIATLKYNTSSVKPLELNKKLIQEIKNKTLDKEASNKVLKIISSTNARGNQYENKKISEKRATYLRNKLFINGIPMSKIITVGVGETILQNECHRRKKCSPKENANNRVTKMYLQTY